MISDYIFCIYIFYIKTYGQIHIKLSHGYLGKKNGYDRRLSLSNSITFTNILQILKIIHLHSILNCKNNSTSERQKCYKVKKQQKIGGKYCNVYKKE